MAIVLNHTIVPARDKNVSAQFFADMFGLSYVRDDSYFAAVHVNDTLTLDFHDEVEGFEEHHYAFHVNDSEFDAILNRVIKAGIPYGSDPWNLENRQLNDWNGGRGVYFCDPNGHILELMTRVPPRK